MPKEPYKKKEFEAFIKTIHQGQVGHWVEIAKALNVDNDTIGAWKKLPEAQEAIQKGIDHALDRMQESGAKDWKMWESKLKMFGINPATKAEVELSSPARGVLEAAGLMEGKGGRETTEDTQGSPNSPTQV